MSPVTSTPFVTSTLGGASLPLVFGPRSDSARSASCAADAVARDRATFVKLLHAHGALLFRGFELATAEAFESLALALAPDLASEYHGPAPRNALTRHVFTASELPGFVPISQHLEMSFVPNPPRVLFFAALRPNSGSGGETALADFRAVLRDLDPRVRATFEARGIRNVRNYAAPSPKRGVGLFGLAPWNEVFGTDDRRVVEEHVRASGVTAHFKPNGMLCLESVQPAVRAHPVTGEPTWANHVQVFHPSTASGEYRRLARLGRSRVPSWIPFRALGHVTHALMHLNRRFGSEEDLAMYCTYVDGTRIPDADVEAVRDAIWKNLVVSRWERGDVLVLDNAAVSHGRMPYLGPRVIAAAWA